MRNMVVLTGILGLAGMLFTACSNQPPKADGKKVLTVEQYKELQAKLGDAEKRKENAADQANKASPMEDGAVFLRQERYQQAAAAFEQAVKADPNNSRAWYLLGTCYEKAGQIDQAQLAYKTSYDLMVRQGYIATTNSL